LYYQLKIEYKQLRVSIGTLTIMLGINYNINLIASMVENDTSAIFEELIEDDNFKLILKNGLKNEENIIELAKKLSEYANEYLI